MNCDLSEESEYFTSGSLEEIYIDLETKCTDYPHNDLHLRPPAPSDAVGPRKKKRASASASRIMQDLKPPPLTGYGDTVVVSNPFDDTPSKMCQMMANITCPNMSYWDNTKHGPTGSMMNGLNPRMCHSNMENTRPMANHTNRQNENFQAATNHVPRNFRCPNGVCRHNSANSAMTSQRQSHIDQIENHQLANIFNELNNISVNNHATNNRMNMNTKTQSNQCQLHNQQSNNVPINNLNNAPTQKNINYNANIFENEVFDVDLLVKNSNESIVHIDPITTSQPSRNRRNNRNKNFIPGLSGNVRPNVYFPQSHLHRILTMAAEKHARETKTYPVNQPVIFNNQNPNAPPIYPCGVCHKEVSSKDQGIVCGSGCNFWFHRHCLGLSEDAYNLLKQELYAEWACDNCLRTKNVPMIKYKS